MNCVHITPECLKRLRRQRNKSLKRLEKVLIEAMGEIASRSGSPAGNLRSINVDFSHVITDKGLDFSNYPDIYLGILIKMSNTTGGLSPKDKKLIDEVREDFKNHGQEAYWQQLSMLDLILRSESHAFPFSLDMFIKNCNNHGTNLQ